MHIVVVALNKVQQTGSTQVSSVVSFNGALNRLESNHKITSKYSRVKEPQNYPSKQNCLQFSGKISDTEAQTPPYYNKNEHTKAKGPKYNQCEPLG